MHLMGAKACIASRQLGCDEFFDASKVLKIRVEPKIKLMFIYNYVYISTTTSVNKVLQIQEQ